jgi:sRNA-binding carbon storage regulator CsrA
MITSTAKEVLRIQNKRKPKRLKIWNEELQEAIQKRNEHTS